MTEIKCPCGCGTKIAPAKPTDDLALESFDCKLRIISMPTEELIKLEEAGRVKETEGYRG